MSTAVATDAHDIPPASPPASAGSPAPSPVAPINAGENEIVRVYVWEVPVRVSHWLIVFSMVVLGVTGYYVGRPIVSVPGEAEKHFFMGWMRTVHFYAAIVFTLAVCTRIVWSFIGNKYSRWNQLLPVSPERIKGLWTTLLFYTFARKEPPPSVGHNPMAGVAYMGIFTLYIVMILTGNGMYAAATYGGEPLHIFKPVLAFFGGAEWARWIHHGLMWVFACFAIQHVYSSVLVSQIEHHGELDSIFSGWKFVPRWLSRRD